MIPTNAKEIKERIENNYIETFIKLNVCELFFKDLGLEYIDTDTIEVVFK